MNGPFFQGEIPFNILRKVENLAFLEPNEAVPESEIEDLLQRSVLYGGKRLRPLLTFLVGEFFAVEEESLTSYAKAIELVHAASLSHDDVVDNATVRRNIPSINALSSNKKAVLAGDYLLAQVIVDLCQVGNLKLVSELSAVIQDLAIGEWLQLSFIDNHQLDFSFIERIASKKTASVMKFCTIVAPILAKSSQNTVEKMRAFGHSLGLAFQYIDDAIDFNSQTVSGKEEQQDLKNGIVNSLSFEFFLHNQNEYEEWLKDKENWKIQQKNDELKKAQERVKERAFRELKLAKDALFTVYEELKQNEFSKKQEKAFRSILFLVDYLGRRKY